MRRKLQVVGLTAVGVLTAVLAIRSLLSPGPGAVAAGPDGPNGKPVALPVAQVVLFSSGVGFFQREGEVEGNSRIDLSFRVDDINDLLKSMVLQDMGGGHIGAVSYDSHDPIERTLKSYAVNLNGNPTFSQILNQARGEKIEVVLQQSNTTQPGTLTGTIVGTETQPQAAGATTVNVEVLNLWCAEGMRSVKLNELQRLRFLNPVMENEVRRALETLSLSHDAQKKAVSLLFTGEGKRPVKVSYVVENPIWKTSYRLVLNKEGKPFLQGWAIVENPSDEDWNDVRMGLVSGRPISFKMDLYQPLYVPRPVVEPELFASLRPTTYSGNMRNEELGVADAKHPAMQPTSPPPGFGFAGGGRTNGMTWGVPGPVNPTEAVGIGGSLPTNYNIDRLKEADLDLRQGVASVAAALEIGNSFQYAISQPVTLSRQKSALLPIVHQDVEGTKVSIYNEATHAKFPLLGLKFKNTSGLHLMQGPITVYEGGVYAGDARIEDLQPKDERLISYAVDLGVEVEPIVPDPAARITKIALKKGIMQVTRKVQDTKTYNVKNRSENDRTLLIEHPYRESFKLVKPEKATERARDVYRFEVPVAKSKSASLTVVEEHDELQTLEINNTDDDSIKIFLANTVASTAVKQALQKAMALKAQLAETGRELAHLQQQLKDIVDDQARLRANLKEMPPTAEAYKRYLKKFDDQETEIERLRDQIKKTQDAELTQKTELDKFLMGLDLE